MQGGSGLAFVDAVAPAQSGDEAALEALLGPAQLIGAPPSASQDDDWSFQTRAMTHRAASLRTGIDLFRALIFPVRKVRSTFFARVILVGRAGTSDVCIAHPSISKLHARIRRSEAGTYTIADAGSKNGTWIGGRRIGEADADLEPGSNLRLGDWELRFELRESTVALLRSA